ncbi:MAG: aspartate--ammonia ligase [Candidatus Krumholzibacteria bacterium]|nr:aspartate--ammonia ligase [Candidatus Krumholzibacteria bacterium]
MRYFMADNTADLAGPGVSICEELAKVLPDNYENLLSSKDTMKALYKVKSYIEENLCKELNLMMVQCPLIMDKNSGMNDYLDRDGSRTPVDFGAGLGLDRRIETQVVQAVTKWKRFALKQYECDQGEGICTDMRAVRKDYFLVHDHSSYVDQWDWERVCTEEERTLEALTDTVKKIWKVLRGAEDLAHEMYPVLDKFPKMPDELYFIHAEDLLAKYPDLPRKQREAAILQEHPAIFIYGIGWTLEDGYPHEMRAADYDDWVSETVSEDGRPMHGLNGDILIWNSITNRRHELTSMGVRVTAETLRKQLEITGQKDFLEMPYHQMILNGDIPLSIGGGLGQSRIYSYILKKAALGEVSVTIWPEQLHELCDERGIHLLK